MKGGIAYPAAQMLWITVTHSRAPGWTSSGRARLSEPVTTFIKLITPIWKPVSSKLCTSSSWTPYLALVSSTSLNHAPIISGSSCSILYLSLARLKAILSSAERVTKRAAQHLTTGSPPRTASSLSAISATSHSRGAIPRESRSRIYWTIVCSSVAVSLCRALRVSRRCGIPLYRRASVARGTLNASAASRRL
jgi:hypothetical protein